MLHYLQWTLLIMDFTYKYITNNSFAYNINKCDITSIGQYLKLILLITEFTHN